MSGPIDTSAILAGCALFSGAAQDDIRALAAIATLSSWKSGVTIFQQGDPAEFLIVIHSGRVRLALATASGKELTIRYASNGDAVGEMGVLDHEPRSADAAADSDTTGLVIRRAALTRLLTERPSLALTLIRYLSKRLRETTYQLESVALYELSARLARFLLATLRQVHGENLPATASLKLDLAQGEIAAILGASRPKLNRALGELEEQGAIMRQGRSLTCNIARLTASAEADGD
jgi:CRP-like cAMP-binding protein